MPYNNHSLAQIKNPAKRYRKSLAVIKDNKILQFLLPPIKNRKPYKNIISK
jgi:hypothetical protein